MTESISIEQYVRDRAARVEQALSRVFEEGAHELHPTLKQAMNYSLMAGGKRMRPVLMIAAAESLNAGAEDVLQAACAVEMIHTYSLIHDDLPAMDDDDFRRGKPTSHKVYGEAMAILAGDGLLTHAFRVAAETVRRLPNRTPETLRVLSEMSRFAGPYGMVGGQAADMEGGVSDVDHLEAIHRRKTGDLIVFSLRAGGILSGATSEQLDALEAFGRNIGLAFQIQDDILDIVGDEEALGKPLGSDEKSNKATYPVLLGLDRCREMVATLTEEGKERIRAAGFPNPSRLLELADLLTRRDR